MSIRRHALALLLIVALVVPSSSARAQYPPKDSVDKATQVLLHQTVFSAALVGFVAQASPAAIAWRVIDRMHDSTVFLLLVRSRNTATQLYALAGLYGTNRTRFEKEIVPFLKRRDSLLVEQYDFGSFDAVRDIALEIRAGIWTSEFRSMRPHPHWSVNGLRPGDSADPGE